MKILASIALSLLALFTSVFLCVLMYNYMHSIEHFENSSSSLEVSWFYTYTVISGLILLTSPAWIFALISFIVIKINKL